MDIEVLDGDVLSCVRQALGLDPDDDSGDTVIEKMDQVELFEYYLTWNGIVGFSDQILQAVRDIYYAYEEDWGIL